MGRRWLRKRLVGEVLERERRLEGDEDRRNRIRQRREGVSRQSSR
jgi:hypothetical protein